MNAATDQKAMQTLCADKAQEMWAAFSANEGVGIRFGLFPARPMMAADKDGYDGRLLAVALMDCASKNGWMRA